MSKKKPKDEKPCDSDDCSHFKFGTQECSIAQLKGFYRVPRIIPWFAIFLIIIPLAVPLFQESAWIMCLHAKLIAFISSMNLIPKIELKGSVKHFARLGIVANTLRLFLSLWLTEDVFMRISPAKYGLWDHIKMIVGRFADFLARLFAALCVYLAVLFAKNEGLIAIFILACYVTCFIWDGNRRISDWRNGRSVHEGIRAFRKVTAHWLVMDFIGTFVASLHLFLVWKTTSLKTPEADQGGILACMALVYSGLLFWDFFACRYNPKTGKSGWKCSGVYLYWLLLFRKPIILFKSND